MQHDCASHTPGLFSLSGGLCLCCALTGTFSPCTMLPGKVLPCYKGANPVSAFCVGEEQASMRYYRVTLVTCRSASATARTSYMLLVHCRVLLIVGMRMSTFGCSLISCMIMRRDVFLFAKRIRLTSTYPGATHSSPTALDLVTPCGTTAQVVCL